MERIACYFGDHMYAPSEDPLADSPPASAAGPGGPR